MPTNPYEPPKHRVAFARFMTASFGIFAALGLLVFAADGMPLHFSYLAGVVSWIVLCGLLAGLPWLIFMLERPRN